MKFDQEKNAAQLKFIRRLVPWVMAAWIAYEFLLGDVATAIFFLIVLVGLGLVELFTRHSSFMNALRESERSSKFQWKVELVAISLLILTFVIGFYASRFVSNGT